VATANADTWTVITSQHIPPQSMICNSCHDSDAAKIHTELNRNASGEACAVCHGPGKTYDVLEVHVAAP